MNIKKVDDKPMVIHTKEKAKLHMHEPKKAEIKAANTYTVGRGPDVGKASIGKTRSSTVHTVDGVKKSMFNQYRAALSESKRSIKTKTSSIKVAGAAGAQTALSQVEGGDEIRDASVAVAGTVAGAETGPAAPLIGIAAGMVAGEAVASYLFHHHFQWSLNLCLWCRNTYHQRLL